MTDCFISYKREDAAAVGPIVDALRAGGVEAWWDQDLAPGDRWRERIAEQLDAARCVLVFWTRASVGPAGTYVREEAERAKARGVLLPVLLESVAPPFGFAEIQAIDLADLLPNPVRDRRWPRFVASIQAKLAGAPLPARPRSRVQWWSLAGVATFALAAIGVLNGLGGLRSMLCDDATMIGACQALRIPGVPSREEEQLWQTARTSAGCDGLKSYLDRYPAGAFLSAAQGRYAARTAVDMPRWIDTEKKWALVVAAETAPSEAAARQRLALQIDLEASRFCAGLDPELYRVRGFKASGAGVRCAPTAQGQRCGYDGEVVCQLKERHLSRQERCGP